MITRGDLETKIDVTSHRTQVITVLNYFLTISVVFFHLLDSQLFSSIDRKTTFSFVSCTNDEKVCCRQWDSSQAKKKTNLRLWSDINFSLFHLRFPCHAHLYRFSLFVSENSRILQGDAEPQITLADLVFKMRFAFHLTIIIYSMRWLIANEPVKNFRVSGF